METAETQKPAQYGYVSLMIDETSEDVAEPLMACYCNCGCACYVTG